MQEKSILWLDDEWIEQSTGVKELERWCDLLKADLVQAGVIAHITCRSNAAIWNDLGTRHFDLLIIDYELSKDPVVQNAFHLLDQLEARLKNVPPVVIFSIYPRHELEAAAGKHTSSRIYAVFNKGAEGAKDLSICVVQLLSSRPLSFVVMSDFHSGYLDETAGISQERFLDSLYTCLESVVKEHQIDALFACGDFAWKHQHVELVQTFKLIQHVSLRLGLREHDQVFLCPGNHDIDFSSGSPSWDSFGELIGLLSTTDQGFLRRFVHRNSDVGSRRPFHDQVSLFSIVHNERLGIVVVGLNSNQATGNGVGVAAAIDEDQWHAVTRALERYPNDLLRIALLHHPIFSAPGGVYQDESALENQGKAMQMLAKAGVSLIFHGHTHFSAVHAHRIAVVNGPEALGSQRGAHVVDLVTVACPSLIAEPSTVAPQRQFLIVTLDSVDPRSGTRAFSLHSKVFNPASCTWSNGMAMPTGYFRVGAMLEPAQGF